MKRYIELKDFDNKPIFEGDKLSLNLREEGSFFGNSNLIQFCNKFDVDTVIIDILENENYLEVKYKTSFFKNGNQIITNREAKSYFLKLKDDSKEEIENPEDLYVEESDSFLFLRYITSKRIRKISGKEEEFPKKELDSNLKIKTSFSDNIFVGDSIEFEVTPEIRESNLIKSIESNDFLEKTPYSKLVFHFKRNEKLFENEIFLRILNEKNEPSIFDVTLNEKAQKIEDEYIDKIKGINRKIRRKDKKETLLERKEIEELSEALEALYHEKDNIIYKEYIEPLNIDNRGLNGIEQFVKLGYKYKIIKSKEKAL